MTVFKDWSESLDAENLSKLQFSYKIEENLSEKTACFPKKFEFVEQIA